MRRPPRNPDPRRAPSGDSGDGTAVPKGPKPRAAPSGDSGDGTAVPKGPKPRAAMDQALMLLKFRGRSEREMSARLAKKGFERTAVNQTVSRLKELGLLNDAALARDWTAAARRAHKGDHRIRLDLLKRGLSRPSVDQALKDADNGEALPGEDERAWDALQKRAPRVKALDSRAQYQRLFGHLARRGFSVDAVRSALKRFFEKTPEMLEGTSDE